MNRALLPALAAVLGVLLVLMLLDRLAELRVQRCTRDLASLNLPELARGVALQRRIARLPDHLIVYGSSELSNFEPTRADLFFRDHPEAGFNACVIGQPGDRCLLMLQELASLGENIRGRKVVIFLSSNWFVAPDESLMSRRLARQFTNNFSPAQISLTLLNDRLKPALKQQIARRLLDHESAIADASPLLAQALGSFRDPAPRQTVVRWLLQPLLMLQAEIFCWQDRRATAKLVLIHSTPPGAPVGRTRQAPLDWTGLTRNIDDSLAQHGVATPYSLDLPSIPSPGFLSEASPFRLYPRSDAEFQARLNASKEWLDLELLLRTIRRVRAHVLLINQPFNGTLYDSLHVSPLSRRLYYDRVRAMADECGIALSDFSRFEMDRSFFSDLLHPSAKAWIYYDRIMARFYHEEDRSPRPFWARHGLRTQ